MNTIDLDFKDREFLHVTMQKIIHCRNYIKGEIKDTAKGYHYRLWCKIDCDLCRVVFDDQRRFEKDIKRLKSSQNVLHQRKWLIRNGKETRVW